MPFHNMKKKNIMRALIALIVLAGVVFTAGAQVPSAGQTVGIDETPGFNPLRTAVPFLTIAPDSRAGGMGDVGVATDPDPASQHWNPAKYMFMRENAGAHVSYIPWLRNLVPDINLAYVSGFYKIDKQQAISGSLRYFSLGQMIFTNEYNQEMGRYNPNEFALDAAYSRLFSENFSGAVTFRFIRSDFGRAFVSTVGETKAGVSFAADVAWFYHKDIEINDKDAKLSIGMNISNMGSALSYTDNKSKEKIPTNLRFGGSLKTYLHEYNSFALSLDMNKLLVPTPPNYTYDSTSQSNIILPGNGMDPNVSLLTGMVHSFYDAPAGFREEMQEIIYTGGLEYGYRDQFFVRGGYFHEAMNKGNRKYYTLGFGLRWNVLLLDFAYMVPVGGRTSPLANTMRFSLGFLLGQQKKSR